LSAISVNLSARPHLLLNVSEGPRAANKPDIRHRFVGVRWINCMLNKAIVDGHMLLDESARCTDVEDDRHQVLLYAMPPDFPIEQALGHGIT
jgi:hypothetical protein